VRPLIEGIGAADSLLRRRAPGTRLIVTGDHERAGLTVGAVNDDDISRDAVATVGAVLSNSGSVDGGQPVRLSSRGRSRSPGNGL
jgi:hypothetical protein